MPRSEPANRGQRRRLHSGGQGGTSEEKKTRNSERGKKKFPEVRFSFSLGRKQGAPSEKKPRARCMWRLYGKEKHAAQKDTWWPEKEEKSPPKSSLRKWEPWLQESHRGAALKGEPFDDQR